MKNLRLLIVVGGLFMSLGAYAQTKNQPVKRITGIAFETVNAELIGVKGGVVYARIVKTGNVVEVLGAKDSIVRGDWHDGQERPVRCGVLPNRKDIALYFDKPLR